MSIVSFCWVNFIVTISWRIKRVEHHWLYFPTFVPVRSLFFKQGRWRMRFAVVRTMLELVITVSNIDYVVHSSDVSWVFCILLTYQCFTFLPTYHAVFGILLTHQCFTFLPTYNVFAYLSAYQYTLSEFDEERCCCECENSTVFIAYTVPDNVLFLCVTFASQSFDFVLTRIFIWTV